MSDALADIDRLEAAATLELGGLCGVGQLEEFRIRYLGTRGKLKDAMKLLGTAPADQRATLGQRLNSLRATLTAAFEARSQALQSSVRRIDAIDVTEPAPPRRLGRYHVVNRVSDELCDLFGKLGFTVARGPELEDEWHNFVALNIPDAHPARDPSDNFYLTPINPLSDTTQEQQSPSDFDTDSVDHRPSLAASRGKQALLRTQTSTVQIRVMETRRPPIRVVIPGRVYRPDTTDATHLPMFHQLEALVVEQGVTMIDLKSTVLQFVRAYFGQDTRIRFRPSFFPFTEPSAEVDVWFEDKQRWIELGGCGMVHPNVLRNCNLDPETYTGWAFGFGIERITMRKYAIPDIRMLVENDARFLMQF